MHSIKSRQQERDEESRQMDIIMEISRATRANLSVDTLSALVDLLQAGVSVEKVVAIVTELQRVANKN